MTNTNELIAILGLSPKSERYSYMACQKLQENGYRNLIGVTPREGNILGVKLVRSISDLKDVHTLTVYVGAAKLEPMIGEIISLRPKRVVLNPGTDSDIIYDKLVSNGISTLRACTLVMLSSKKF